MKIIEEKDIESFNLMKGDTLVLRIKSGEETKEILSADIGSTMHVNHAVIFQIEPGEFGFKNGVGGMVVER